MKYKTKQILKYLGLGMLGALLLGVLIVCIGSAVNGVTFGEQITQWFGANGAVETAVEQLTENTGA